MATRNNFDKLDRIKIITTAISTSSFGNIQTWKQTNLQTREPLWGTSHNKLTAIRPFSFSLVHRILSKTSTTSF